MTFKFVTNPTNSPVDQHHECAVGTSSNSQILWEEVGLVHIWKADGSVEVLCLQHVGPRLRHRVYYTTRRTLADLLCAISIYMLEMDCVLTVVSAAYQHHEMPRSAVFLM